MLSNADRDCVMQEKRLPGMALVLDADAVGELLSRQLSGASVDGLRQTYAHYRPAASCLVNYVAIIDGVEVEFYAKAFLQDEPNKLRKSLKAMKHARPEGPGGFVDDAFNISVLFFPNDMALAQLIHAYDLRKRKRLFTRLLPELASPQKWVCQRIHYKPERRCVYHCWRKKSAFKLKLYDTSGYALARSVVGLGASTDAFSAPSAFGYSDADRAIASEWVRGESLEALILDQRWSSAQLRGVGLALADFQHHARPGMADHRPINIAARLIATCQVVARTLPPQGERIRQVSERIAVALEASQVRACTVHGDFTTDQVVFRKKRMFIVDLDAVGRGDCHTDLGSFLARLEFEALQGKLDRDAVHEIRSELLNGYCKTNKHLNVGQLELHIAAALLRLLPDPFRYRFAQWPNYVEALVNLAEVHYDRSQKSIHIGSPT